MTSVPTVQNDLAADHYRITVTSTVTPTYAELCKAYDGVNEAWDGNRHRLELHESLREIAPSAGDKIVFIKKFDPDPYSGRSTSRENLKWLKDSGYRLAFPWEREAFSKANPTLKWIVDLGSFAVFDGRRRVPILFENRGPRFLGRIHFDYWWTPRYRFLFVRV